MRYTALLLAGLGLLLGCGEDAAVLDAGRDAAVDAGPPPPSWPGRLPSATTMGMRRGRSVARAVVHLHSPLSHDACDGAGWIDGELADAECLAHLRDSLCALHVDAAMLTDHAPHVEEVDLSRALWIEGDDEPVLNDDGDVVASRMACDDGHRVLITAGSENTLMPLALERHPGDPSDPGALRAAYDLDGPEAAAAFRAAGALVWQAHTEGRDLATLRAIGIDGLEIYNLHANVDPTIREEHLGLDGFGYTDQLLEFTNRRYGLPPDLALLAFLSENQNALDKWDALLAEGLHIPGSGGCDAHENALPMELTDGERADSYRRMMFWIENHLLVDEVSPSGVRDALSTGRFFVVFEALGTPVGVDFIADDGGTTHEMGEDAPLGATLRLVRPRLPDDWPSDPDPILSMRIVRASADGAIEVASGDVEVLEHVTTEPGAYRAEVRITPEHARPFLGDRADALIRELPWVYTNAIHIVE